MIFHHYAYYYDAYYADKDYSSEVDFILKLVRSCGGRRPRSVLDIGCGTARHLIAFADKGLKSYGIDQSQEMIKIARNNIQKTGVPDIKVQRADATTYRGSEKFDLVVSNFAALGFISKTKDLLAAITTARVHLKKGGLFIFDGWFGPAVLKILPSLRQSVFVMGKDKVTRIVEPIAVDPIGELVRTKNTIIHQRGAKVIKRIVEFHEIRFFFIQELEVFFELTGFRLKMVCPFMEMNKKLTEKDWNISIVAQAM